MINNKAILITGATGSFGKKMVETLIKNYKLKKLIIYSRDELKQSEMQHLYPGSKYKFLRYFIGDVRDYERLKSAFENVDIVIHAAALKQVNTAEYNPLECIKTNINGAMNLVDACIDQGVKKVVALSTDKASSPINLYGATKLASDKLFIASNSSYASSHKTSFAVVRYGNVMGSRGSVIPFFMSIKDKGELLITDERMTRFMISLDQGIDLVCHAFNDMIGGEIYVKKIPSMKVIDIAQVIAPDAKKKIVGIRVGEKLHEEMISKEDSYSCYEYPKYYKILPQINNWNKDKKRIKNGKKLPEDFCYNSKNNSKWMTKIEFKNWLDKNQNLIGKI